MKLNLVRVATVAVALLLTAASDRASAAAGRQSVEIFQTNLASRFITNVIEVRAPHNVFVDEYRTNWVHRTFTNVIDVVATNWTTRTLTNWQTVVVTKTNWIHQPATNFVEINKTFTTAVLLPNQAAQPEAKSDPAPIQAVADTLALQTTKTARPFDNNGMEILFKVGLSSDATATLENPQWRVERDDGAVFFAAQSQQFSRSLPPGHYKIEVKAHRDANGPLLKLQSTMIVTRDTVAQR